jgi:hypothetical protein
MYTVHGAVGSETDPEVAVALPKEHILLCKSAKGQNYYLIDHNNFLKCI